MSIFVQCIDCKIDGWHITQMYKRSNVCRNCHTKRKLTPAYITDKALDKLSSLGLNSNQILELIKSRLDLDTHQKP
jgi:hypothetical protein